MKKFKLSFDSPNPSRRIQLVDLDCYAHDWGLLVPCPSGFLWEQQTMGVACHHVAIEGVFIPLKEPNDYLAKLRIANYEGKSTKIIWKKIKETMKQWENLDWQEVENPDPSRFPDNQEGFQWIKIIDWSSSMGRGKQLIGETVALIYPNCD